MPNPTTKDTLLARIQTGHQEFYDVLARIPDDRMNEIALYDNWSIKDFIAHIAAWEQITADRVASWRRGETVPRRAESIDEMNAQFLTRYRDMPLSEIRAMEASAFAAIQQQVNEATDAELFDPQHFAGRKTALLSMIAADTYEHYAEHLPDVRAWMQKNGID